MNAIFIKLSAVAFAFERGDFGRLLTRKSKGK